MIHRPRPGRDHCRYRVINLYVPNGQRRVGKICHKLAAEARRWLAKAPLIPAHRVR
jgi:hypothetical protein